MNRRSFLSRTGILLGSIGVAEMFAHDLMARLGVQMLPSANAETVIPFRQIDLCFRAGIPMMIFGTGQEFAKLQAPRYSNFSYSGDQVKKSNQVSNLFLNEDSQSLMKHSKNMAITQGVLNESGHTGMFDFREGGLGKGRTTPVVETANLNSTGSLLHGVQWPGDVQNRANAMKDLVAVNGEGAFVSLFKNSKLRLDAGEVKTVLQAADKLSRRQALLLETKLDRALSQAENHRKATQMFAADYASLLNTQGMAGALTSGNMYMTERAAMARTLKGLQNNLINSAVINFDLGDWHGFQTDKQNSNIIRNVSEMIAAMVDFLKSTPEPTAPHLTLWDTTTIVAGSEFTRGVAQFDTDNNDGGTQGVMIIGKRVRGNYYGGFSLTDSYSQSNAMAHGFDRTTGQITMNQKNTPEQVHFTIKQAVGLNLSATERELLLTCMVA